MATYEFECTACGAKKDIRMTLEERKEEEKKSTEGAATIICDCGSPMAYAFSPSVQAKLSGVGWVSRDGAEKRYRSHLSGVMARRQRDHKQPTKLVPNLGGQEAASWKEVRAEVAGKKGALAASTYDHMVAKEAKS